jgi:hypothetical protein
MKLAYVCIILDDSTEDGDTMVVKVEDYCGVPVAHSAGSKVSSSTACLTLRGGLTLVCSLCPRVNFSLGVMSPTEKNAQHEGCVLE